MSYLKSEDIKFVEGKYGRPEELATEIVVTGQELERIRRSQHSGRAHDITLFILKGDRLLFIAKHSR